MKIVLAADHGGFELKEKIKFWLMDRRVLVDDVGAFEMINDDDYVDYAKMLVDGIGDDTRGLLFCRNGFGMVMAANKRRGIRCGLGFDVEAVRRGRLDDDINCLAIPSDYVDEKSVMDMVEVFMNTGFSQEEKYKRRLEKLEKI